MDYIKLIPKLISRDDPHSISDAFDLCRELELDGAVKVGLNSIFHGYAPSKGEIPRRATGSLVAFETGEAVGYGIFNVQDRGSMFVSPGDDVYAGMIVGVSNKADDITVNVCKKKQLTNMRASGSDDALRLVPPRILSLEQMLEFLADDELLEVTPKTLRMRKRILDHSLRMKALKGKQ